MTDETTFIARLWQGEASAFQELVELYKKKVYGLAYDLTRNHHDAEDISQEVFLRVFRSFKTFCRSAKLSTWIYRITVNTSIDSLRRKPREASDPLPFSLDKEAARGFSSRPDYPERIADARLLEDRIEKALANISERERTVFVLRHYQGLDLKDIAEVLDISIGSVKSYLFRSIQKLRRELCSARNLSSSEVAHG